MSAVTFLLLTLLSHRVHSRLFYSQQHKLLACLLSCKWDASADQLDSRCHARYLCLTSSIIESRDVDDVQWCCCRPVCNRSVTEWLLYIL